MTFSKEQHRDLERALKDADSKARDAFIQDLDTLCTAYTEFLEADRTGNRKELDRMLRRFRNATEDLELLMERKVWFDDQPATMPEIIEHGRGTLHADGERWRLISQAFESLSTLTILIEETLQERPTGRPKADESQFTAEVKRAYEHHVGKVSPNYKDGPFYQVIKIALASIGQHIEYPARHISPTKLPKNK